jgi:hypothetical protein
MTPSDADRPLTELLASLGATIPHLLRKEIELAKADAAEAANSLLDATVRLAVGVVFAIGAAGVLLAAAVSGIKVILVWLGLDPLLAASVAALAVAAAASGIAWIMFNSATSAARTARSSLERSANSLTDDAKIIVERL